MGHIPQVSRLESVRLFCDIGQNMQGHTFVEHVEWARDSLVIAVEVSFDA